MTIVKIAIILLQVSIFLIVFSLGLEETWESATSLLRRPAMLARSLLSVNIATAVVAAVLAVLFHMNPAVKIALIFLAVSPLPPLLPQRQLKLGGRSPYVYGLLTAMSLLSIVIVPVAVEVLGKLFGRDIHVGPLAVAKVVGRTILLPMGLGMLVHARAPVLARKAGVPLGRFGNLLLLVAALPLMVFAWRPVFELIGHGEVVAMIIFTLVAVAIGHWLGGPDPAERRILALASASHHPSLAMALAAANFPQQRRLVAAAIVLYLGVSAVVLLPYIAWCKRQMARTEARSGTQQQAA